MAEARRDRSIPLNRRCLRIRPEATTGLLPFLPPILAQTAEFPCGFCDQNALVASSFPPARRERRLGCAAAAANRVQAANRDELDMTTSRRRRRVLAGKTLGLIPRSRVKLRDKARRLAQTTRRHGDGDSDRCQRQRCWLLTVTSVETSRPRAHRATSPVQATLDAVRRCSGVHTSVDWEMHGIARDVGCLAIALGSSESPRTATGPERQFAARFGQKRRSPRSNFG